MKDSKNRKSVIANSLVWAAMIIAASLLMDGEKQGQTMMIILIGGWFATHSLFADSKQARKAECAMFRRLLGRTNPSK